MGDINLLEIMTSKDYDKGFTLAKYPNVFGRDEEALELFKEHLKIKSSMDIRGIVGTCIWKLKQDNKDNYTDFILDLEGFINQYIKNSYKEESFDELCKKAVDMYYKELYNLYAVPIINNVLYTRLKEKKNPVGVLESATEMLIYKNFDFAYKSIDVLYEELEEELESKDLTRIYGDTTLNYLGTEKKILESFKKEYDKVTEYNKSKYSALNEFIDDFAKKKAYEDVKYNKELVLRHINDIKQNLGTPYKKDVLDLNDMLVAILYEYYLKILVKYARAITKNCLMK